MCETAVVMFQKDAYNSLVLMKGSSESLGVKTKSHFCSKKTIKKNNFMPHSADSVRHLVNQYN